MPQAKLTKEQLLTRKLHTLRALQPKLKLFVWTADWKKGLAFAIASDESEARQMVENSYVPFGDLGTLHILPLNQKTVFYVSGGG